MCPERSMEEMIALIEKKSGKSVAGTILSRAMLDDGLGWSLSVGAFKMPKRHYYGKTIKSVLDQAARELRIKPRDRAEPEAES